MSFANIMRAVLATSLTHANAAMQIMGNVVPTPRTSRTAGGTLQGRQMAAAYGGRIKHGSARGSFSKDKRASRKAAGVRQNRRNHRG